MSEELVSRRELNFQLYQLLDAESLCQRARFNDHNRETFDAVLDIAEKIATEMFAPHNAQADANEPEFDGKVVSMLPQVKEAFDAYREAGFIAGRYDFDEGGMQLPEIIMTACSGYFMAANPATAGYPFLTTAAANVIRNFASEEIKTQFLSSMLRGDFTGTMALTEPHAGSSLVDILTSAVPANDGTYRLKGHKIYISAGEHELSQNIVHLVLAKIKGAPAGVKGISLFAVPKYRLDKHGNPAQKNDVVLAGLLHKLGYRGTTSTALSFGENDDCHGYLVGEPHQGLRYMFMMMNEARLGVGFGAAMIAYRGYRYSLGYAKERTQGRSLDKPKPTDKASAIIHHGDVKRMLLAQKAYAEGAMSLCLYGASLVDDLHTLEDPAAIQDTAQLLDLLTPVIKAWPSEYGPKANDLAIQVLGGAGYTRDYPVEQCWRDNRLNPIHEGTNGIQALDLLTRKLWQSDGAGLDILQSRISAELKQMKGPLCLAKIFQLMPYIEQLKALMPLLGKALKSEQLPNLLANAQCFMNVFSSIVMSWIWLRQANVAEQQLTGQKALTDEDTAFYRGKLQAAKYYIYWELPLVNRDLDLLKQLDSSCADMQPEWF